MSYTYTKRITYICAFCHVRIDGTVYRLSGKRHHLVCYDIVREQSNALASSQTRRIEPTAPFRMKLFSGDITLSLRPRRLLCQAA